MKNNRLLVFVLTLALCGAMLVGCTPDNHTAKVFTPAAETAAPQVMAAQPEGAVNALGEAQTEPAEVPVVQVLSAEEVPAATEPAATVPNVNLCPTCGDLDCDDGKYCDDAHEKAENLAEYARLMNGNLCEVCGDYDCDDGKYCDDADEKVENLQEAEAKKAALSGQTTKTTTKTTTKKTTSSTSGLCPVCADDDCDDGKYCDDADERAENLREAENKKNGTRCEVCWDYDCDDGKYCDDWDDRHDDDHHDD